MKRLSTILAAAALAAPACTDEADPYDGESIKTDDGKTDASALAVFVDFTFHASLLTDFSWNDTSTIQDQLLYTVGQLNGLNSVGRVDKVVVSNVTKTNVGGKVKLEYDAKLPVAWGKRNNVPQTVEIKLPLDISSSGQQAFAEKYKHGCVDFAAHDVDAGSMFYYYRPGASGCTIDGADVSTAVAQVSPSPIQTTGKFPEMNKVWEDGKLEVLAVFGKYEDGATSASDAGISAYNEFVASMRQELGRFTLTTVPATLPAAPGVASPDVEFSATLPDGKTVHVVALLTDNVRIGLSQPAFRSRYEALSTRADYIVYNGHAGLGTNVRALAQAGKWVAGQYVVVFMNGCDTFAYVDDALNNAHKAVNADDTTGYKYIDLVNNGMPAFFHSMAGATMSLFRGLMAYDAPKTYEQIFKNVDSSQVILVGGEQDNTYTPGGGGDPMAWAGLTDGGSVNRNETKAWSTPTLEAGTYQFAISARGAGDADLYVRVGSAPTTGTYDCRPYKTGSNETCEVTLAQPAPIHVMVRGYAGSASGFDIVGKKL